MSLSFWLYKAPPAFECQRTSSGGESARGDFQDPYSEAEIRAKFRELAGLVLSPEGVARIETLVDRLDELAQIGDFVAALRADRAS